MEKNFGGYWSKEIIEVLEKEGSLDIFYRTDYKEARKNIGSNFL